MDPTADTEGARSELLPASPMPYYANADDHSFMWADLARVRRTAGEEVAAAPAASLRRFHPMLDRVFERSELAPERILRFVISSPVTVSQWVSTVVYDAPVAAALEALLPADQPVRLADDRVVISRRVGDGELLAVAVEPTVVVLGPRELVTSALAAPPRRTDPNVARDSLFTWEIAADGHSSLLGASPSHLRMELSSREDGSFELVADVRFDSIPRADDAEAHWRHHLGSLASSVLIRVLGLGSALSAARFERPAPEEVRIHLPLDAEQLALLARMLANA